MMVMAAIRGISPVIPNLSCLWSTGVTCAETVWDYPVIITIFQIPAPVQQNRALQLIRHSVLNRSSLIAQQQRDYLSPSGHLREKPSLNLSSIPWLCVVWPPVQVRSVFQSLWEVIKNLSRPKTTAFSWPCSRIHLSVQWGMIHFQVVKWMPSGIIML